ncbi:MAG: hypothetical protein H6834_06350 [Planctomycetes bacterium]|nr:hypothetical protein [Planctomycetota bacterium]
MSSLVGLRSAWSSMEPPRFVVSFDAAVESATLDGRMLLILSRREGEEPRFQVRDGAAGQQVFGVDVEGLAPDQDVVFDASVFGYPLPSLADVPAGRYVVQAVLHRYETFVRADGHTVKLPMDRGEGQQWNRAPGNLLSAPRPVTFDPADPTPIRIRLDQVIPPIEPPKDTRYVKHVTIRSELLSGFWGRPMELGACVLLPEGFDEHPEVRYPLIVNHGHFPHTFGGFRPEPPEEDLEPDYSERFRLAGYNRIQQEYAHAFYREWTGPDFPRMVIIEIQHPNPYYDDSYAVNSQNLGPYGDAIQYELIPEVEKRFRCIGEGWARFTYGGSTGGWEALAVQVLYPDEYNGCFAACPDPIDFRAYTVVDVYEDENAYYVEGDWSRIPRPGLRDWRGHVRTTLEQANHLELVLGEHSRSGGQWDIWEAVFSPVGQDGYPKRIWDKRTGVIDRGVARHWQEHYDLHHILERDWKTLGPKLRGKIHIYCGTMDNYYLNLAVERMQEFLESTTDPPYEGLVDFGPGAEHCWNGDHERPNAISRLRYHQMYVDRILARIQSTAPEGADLTSWRY